MRRAPPSRPWLSLAFLALASGCPPDPPDVAPLRDGSPIDAAGPDAMTDARPDMDGMPTGEIMEYGWPPSDEFPLSEDYGPDQVILQHLMVEAPGGGVEYLGMIVKGLSGTRAKIGLYDSDESGEPRALVATTSVFITVPGINQHPPQDRVSLPVGDYWSAVIFDSTTSLATSSTSVSPRRLASEQFGDALPETLLSYLPIDGASINVYIGIRAP